MKQKIDYAFLVHARSLSDIYYKFPILKYLPDILVEKSCTIAPPFVVAKIKGLAKKNGSGSLQGLIIGIPLTAKLMLSCREVAKTRVEQACELAAKHGAKLVGLGAFTSTVTKGGQELIGKTSVKLTNGNALTTGVAFSDIEEIATKSKIKRIGILGATGSIGSALSILLTDRFPDLEYCLVGRSKESMDNLTSTLLKKNGSIKIMTSLNGNSCLVDCDLVIVATSAVEVLLRSEHLKQNAIIYDVTQPRNIELSLTNERPDLVIVEGGGILAPENVQCGFNPIFNGRLVFSCLAETMILAAEERFVDYTIGQVEPEKVIEMISLARDNSFERSPLHCWNE